MKSKQVYLGLDIGSKRIGVAVADSIGAIAQPLTTLQVDGQEVNTLKSLATQHDVTDIIVGLPRDQHGRQTDQTEFVRQFAQKLQSLYLPISWQDESVTSIVAEDRLK